jgi:hypothetical protein
VSHETGIDDTQAGLCSIHERQMKPGIGTGAWLAVTILAIVVVGYCR